jgi:hypothetical protein
MRSSAKVEAALENFRGRSPRGGCRTRCSSSGHPRGAGAEFAEGLLALPFGVRDPAHAAAHCGRPLDRAGEQVPPDPHRGNPRALEAIAAHVLRRRLEGGGDLFADRLNANAQNPLLKTMEEPPPNSLLILATDVPAALLPTIRSRAQFVDVRDDERPSDSPWLATVVELCGIPGVRQACEMLAWTDRLTAPLRSLEELAEAEETARAEAAAVAGKAKAPN